MVEYYQGIRLNLGKDYVLTPRGGFMDGDTVVVKGSTVKESCELLKTNFGADSVEIDTESKTSPLRESKLDPGREYTLIAIGGAMNGDVSVVTGEAVIGSCELLRSNFGANGVSVKPGNLVGSGLDRLAIDLDKVKMPPVAH